MAPVIRECQRRGLDYSIIHTGQHYSYQMDRIFFEQLALPQHIGTETQRISDSSSPIPNSDEPFFFHGEEPGVWAYAIYDIADAGGVLHGYDWDHIAQHIQDDD